MKKIFALMLMASMLGGCAAVDTPVTGFMYANVKAPMAVNQAGEKPQRVGRASVRSILGILATGDASIATAARNGGIREIHYVDYEAQNFFGVLAEYTVVVYGN